MTTLITIYEEVLSGKRKQFPLDTWNQRDSEEILLKLVRYIVLEKLNWNRSNFCEQFCLNTITKFKLNTGFMKVYSRNIFPLINNSFPEWEVKPWEMMKSRVPAGYWTMDNAVAATKWLIEEKLMWSMEQVERNISNTAFLKNHLGGMLRTTNVAINVLIEKAYPLYDWTYLKERNGYKITAGQAVEIRRLYGDGTLNQRQIANIFGINPAQVNLIVHNKTFIEKN